MACLCGGFARHAGGHIHEGAEFTQSFYVSSRAGRRRPGRHGCPASLFPQRREHRSPSSLSISSLLIPVEEASSPAKKAKVRRLFSMASPFNEITVLDIPKESSSDFAGSRILLLDESGNIHSIYKKETNYTNAYWDQFATLPPIVPKGPIAIFGLGGGTSARLMLDLWPSCKILGYEIDEILVDVARDFFDLWELEAPTAQGGVLEVCIEDALEPSATVDGGFAGIVVDLFANGEVLPQLHQPEAWFELKKKLKDGGRIMINCGGTCVEKSDSISELDDGTWTWEDGWYAKEATLRAMVKAFPQTLFRRMGGESDNYMALTGPLPDLAMWAAALPPNLQTGLTEWRSFYQ